MDQKLPGAMNESGLEHLTAKESHESKKPNQKSKKAIFSKILKISTGISLIVICLYIVLTERGIVTSDNAVVSSYKISVRSPIEGYIEKSILERIGQNIDKNETIAIVEDNRIDNQRLVDLRILTNTYEKEKNALEKQKYQLEDFYGSLIARREGHYKASIEYYQNLKVEAEKNNESKLAREQVIEKELARKTTLLRSGFATLAEIDKLRGDYESAKKDTQAAKARMETLQGQVNAAREGIIIDSGSSNDVPYSLQRADEIRIRLTEIERAIDTARTNAYSTRERAQLEAQRVEKLERAIVKSPIDGILWKIGANTGERVGKGEMIAEIVDCKNQFILAAIPQDRFDDVFIGTTVEYRLAGEKEKREGKIFAITGEASVAEDKNLAGAPQNQRTNSAIARIEIQPSQNKVGECLVGRTARVILTSKKGDAKSQLMSIFGKN